MITCSQRLGAAHGQALALGNHGWAQAIAQARSDMRPVRVLTLDGGGMRGYFQSRLLQRLLHDVRTQRSDPSLRIHDLFDIVAGTSTGGILAAGLLTGKGRLAAPGVDRLACLAAFYRSDGSAIFRSRRIVSSLRQATIGKYNPGGLEACLKLYLGADTQMHDTVARLLISTYDIRCKRTHWFDSKAASGGTWVSAAGSPPDPLLWHVARATSAAPTFFPAARFDDLGSSGAWVDGGVGANNPTLKGLTEGIIELQCRRSTLRSHLRLASTDLPDKVVVVSIGNGSRAPRAPRPRLQGIAGWLPQLSSLFMHSTATAAVDIADAAERGFREITSNNEFRPVARVMRLDPPPATVPSELDDTRADVLDKLDEAAQEVAAGGTRSTYAAAVRRIARASTP
jgi:patatin-like phospholipase/acyl hydrolase